MSEQDESSRLGLDGGFVDVFDAGAVPNGPLDAGTSDSTILDGGLKASDAGSTNPTACPATAPDDGADCEGPEPAGGMGPGGPGNVGLSCDYDDITCTCAGAGFQGTGAWSCSRAPGDGAGGIGGSGPLPGAGGAVNLGGGFGLGAFGG